MFNNTQVKTEPLNSGYQKLEKEFCNLLELKDLDRRISIQPSLIESFEKSLEVILSNSYRDCVSSEDAHLFLQRILYRINRLRLFWYDDLENYSNENSLFLFKIRNQIESLWQGHESAKFDNESLTAIDVAEGLRKRVRRDLEPEDSPENLYFRNELTETGYRRLLAISSLDGLVEASQLSRVIGGAANEIQSMITRIFLEEYGGGQLRRKHSSYFSAMLEEFDMSVKPEFYLDLVPWQVLANINHSFYLCDRNRYFLRYMGGLLYTEVSVPSSFINFRQAGERLGLSRSAIEYWDLHIKEDKKHGQWMLEDVGLPLAERYKENAWEILWGYDQQRLISSRAGQAVVESVKEAERDRSVEFYFDQLSTK